MYHLNLDAIHIIDSSTNLKSHFGNISLLHGHTDQVSRPSLFFL